jgi:paraquat-inducible protein B
VSKEKQEPRDHGQVVRKHGRISFAWLFPLIALGAAAWMYLDYVRSLGPEIEIRFNDAPGVEAGKTPLIFRGVVAGTATEVNLDKELDQAIVTVRLEKFAAGLAVQSTDFWIERPEISLQGASGLTSLISGNSIRARQGTGQPRYEFTGLDDGPVLSPEQTSFRLRLESEQTQPLDRGAPVTYRGVKVGRVREQSLSPEGKPYIDLSIEQSKRGLLKASSRFWTVPASSVTMGPGGIKVDVSGLDTLIQGGVAFDDFGVDGEPLAEGTAVPLLESEALAKACGEPVTISFPNGRGLRSGQTRMTYFGIPVGMVTDLAVAGGQVRVTARFNPGFEFLRSAGSRFVLVEPEISLQGISGLETLITGVVIECEPGHGGSLETEFAGVVPKTDDTAAAVTADETSFRLRLESEQTQPLDRGAPVTFRGVKVGRVREQALTPEGKPYIEIAIDRAKSGLLKTSSRFWSVSASSVSMGPGGIKVDVSALDTLIQGAVAFDDFGVTGEALSDGAMSVLFDSEAMAKACGEPFVITFPKGRGLRVGQTRLTRLGIPVGLVTDVTAVGDQVRVTARFNPGFDALRAAGSKFTLVEPQISLKGVSGLETLITGVTIECDPGRGSARAASFAGHVPKDEEDPALAQSRKGRHFRLISRATSTSEGAPVLYRDLQVGTVLDKSLAADGKAVELVVGLEPEHANLVRENTVFWDERGLRGSIGFFNINIQTAIPLPVIGGGAIAFATPDDSAPAAPAGAVFTLYDKPQREWKKWREPAVR